MIQAFNNDVRCIDVQLKIYFDEEPLIVDKENYLISFDLLEELSSDGSTPFGSISSNELDFSLFNSDDMFTPTNEEGPYYGKIETNTKVEILVREELSDTDWIQLGTFYVYDWECNQSNSCVSVTCNDKMQQLMKLPMPIYMVKQNISVGQFLSELFEKVGLKTDEYNIDVNLSKQMLKYAYPLYGNLGLTLADIAMTQLCYIYVDRNEILQVKSIKTINNSVTTFSDDNQILECKVKQTLLQEHSTVIVTYCNKSITDNVQMIELNEQNVNPGENEFSNIIIEKGPMFLPAHCLCEGSQDAYVSAISYTPWDISLNINNTHNKEQEIKIYIYGSVINTDAKAYITGTIENLVYRMGELPLEINGEYLDSEEHAKMVRDIMVKYISNPTPIIEMHTRGNPGVTVGDVISIENTTNKIQKDVIVLRQEFKFNDGMECTMLCLDKAIVTKAVM